MAKKKVTKKTTTVITEEVINNVDEYTHLIFLLDKSGSMGINNIIDDARGGVNAYLKKQKEKNLGKATASIYLFDDTFEEIYSVIDLDEAKELTSDEWYPQGMTRLYDALGKTINQEKKMIKNLKKKDRPDKVLFVITTDGNENDSREYNGTQIKDLIKNQEEDGWKFIYTAAGQDAFRAGTTIGISGGNTFSFSNTSSGYNDYSVTLDAATTNYRSMSRTAANFTAQASNLMGDADSSKSDDNDEAESED